MLVGVMRRVGVSVTVRVKLIVAVIDMVGAGLVKSTVGVSVAGSRVGIGAWVGVDTKVPLGTLIKVGRTWVGVGASVAGARKVGVAGRSSSDGRTNQLAVPAQYKTDVPMRMMARQP